MVMLTFGLTEPDLLIILLISMIFLGNTVKNTFNMNNVFNTSL